MKKELSLISSKNSFLAQFFFLNTVIKSLLKKSKMLSWQELDSLDHYSWCPCTKKDRTACLQEIGNETWDALLMLCSEQVGSFSYSFVYDKFRFNTRKNNQIFSLQGIQSYVDGVTVEPVLDVLAFWAIRKHERGLLLACLEVWRKGTLDMGILQALRKRVYKSFKLYCIKNNFYF